MHDRCKIERPTGQETVDPVTHKVSRTLDPVYPLGTEDGRCKVKQEEGQANNPDAGTHRFTVQGSVVSVPVSAGPVRVNDIITILEPAFNPALAGTEYRVAELSKQSAATAQRVRVEELTG
jgi:phage baseplate assembly protein gpV